MKLKTIIAATLITAPLLFAPDVRGALSFGLNSEFSGGTAPASALRPWTEVTFTSLSPTSVQLTVQNPNLTGSENVRGLYLNFNDSRAVGNLVFSSPLQTGSFILPTINLGMNAYKADGDGRYDIFLDFAAGGDLSETFGDDEVLTYTLSFTGGNLAESDFNFLSQPAGGKGPFYAAAHVQNTPGGSSGWICPNFSVVPEPSTLGAVLTCSLLFLGFGFLRRAKTA